MDGVVQREDRVPHPGAGVPTAPQPDQRRPVEPHARSTADQLGQLLPGRAPRTELDLRHGELHLPQHGLHGAAQPVRQEHGARSASCRATTARSASANRSRQSRSAKENSPEET